MIRLARLIGGNAGWRRAGRSCPRRWPGPRWRRRHRPRRSAPCRRCWRIPPLASTGPGKARTVSSRPPRSGPPIMPSAATVGADQAGERPGDPSLQVAGGAPRHPRSSPGTGRCPPARRGRRSTCRAGPRRWPAPVGFADGDAAEDDQPGARAQPPPRRLEDRERRRPRRRPRECRPARSRTASTARGGEGGSGWAPGGVQVNQVKPARPALQRCGGPLRWRRSRRRVLGRSRPGSGGRSAPPGCRWTGTTITATILRRERRQWTRRTPGWRRCAAPRLRSSRDGTASR